MRNLLLLLYYLMHQQNMDISQQLPKPAILQGQFTYYSQKVKLQMYSDSIRFKSSQIECALSFCFDLLYEVKVRSKQWVLIFYLNPPFQSYKSIQSSQLIKFEFTSDQDIHIWDIKLIEFIKRKGFNRIFRQEDKLGQGGYGQVYQIWNFFTSKTSATKVIKKEKMYQTHKMKRGLEKEIGILRKIKNMNENQENLLQVEGIYEDQNKIYITMELINGKNLREIFAQQCNSLTIPKRRIIMKGILTGLAALCKNNIIHRDIKPENIMISETGKIKIVDFGLATELNSQLIFKLCGTPGYLAPELVVKNQNQMKTTTKMDVFGAGTILYEMIFKKPLIEVIEGQTKAYQHSQMKFDLEILKLKFQKSQVQLDLLSKMLVSDPQVRISAQQALKHDYFWKNQKKGLRFVINKEYNGPKMLINEKDKQASMGAPVKRIKREKQN